MRAWEPHEDTLIAKLIETLGPSWKAIVPHLPGRTVASVRNRWQRIEKGRKLREEGVEMKNRCAHCGEPKRGHVCMARLGQARAAATFGSPGSSGAGSSSSQLLTMGAAAAAGVLAGGVTSSVGSKPAREPGSAANLEAGEEAQLLLGAAVRAHQAAAADGASPVAAVAAAEAVELHAGAAACLLGLEREASARSSLALYASGSGVAVASPAPACGTGAFGEAAGSAAGSTAGSAASDAASITPQEEGQREAGTAEPSTEPLPVPAPD